MLRPTKVSNFVLSENDKIKNTAAAFTALPGGYRNNNGNFNNMGYNGYWWSATESGATNAWNRKLNYNNSQVNRNNNNKQNGFSVRCVRDSKQSSWQSGSKQPLCSILSLDLRFIFLILILKKKNIFDVDTTFII